MTSKRKSVLVSALIIACVFLAIPFAFLSHEPTYNGKPLSTWVSQLPQYDGDDNGFHPPDSAPPVRAIRSAGSAAFPHLLRWLTVPEHTHAYDHPNAGAALLLRIPLVRNALMPWNNPANPKKESVVLAFRVLGRDAKPVIPELEKIICSLTPSPKYHQITMTDYETFNASLESLAAIGPDALPSLLRIANAFEGIRQQWEIVHQIGNLGEAAAPAIPSLLNWLKHKNYWVRAAAAYSLGEIVEQPTTVVPALRAALNDSEWMVRRDAAGALGNFGAAASVAIDDLLCLTRDPDEQVRLIASEALEQIKAK